MWIPRTFASWNYSGTSWTRLWSGSYFYITFGRIQLYSYERHGNDCWQSDWIPGNKNKRSERTLHQRFNHHSVRIYRFDYEPLYWKTRNSKKYDLSWRKTRWIDLRNAAFWSAFWLLWQAQKLQPRLRKFWLRSNWISSDRPCKSWYFDKFKTCGCPFFSCLSPWSRCPRKKSVRTLKRRNLSPAV